MSETLKPQNPQTAERMTVALALRPERYRNVLEAARAAAERRCAAIISPPRRTVLDHPHLKKGSPNENV